jgi:hypothetical protein
MKNNAKWKAFQRQKQKRVAQQQTWLNDEYISNNKNNNLNN